VKIFQIKQDLNTLSVEVAATIHGLLPSNLPTDTFFGKIFSFNFTVKTVLSINTNIINSIIPKTRTKIWITK
jgi:hypothetical protein